MKKIIIALVAVDICISILNNQKLRKIMATLAELQTAVSDLQTSVDTKQQAIADAIKALEDAINSPGRITEEDLQPIVDSLRSTQADVESTPTSTPPVEPPPVEPTP